VRVGIKLDRETLRILSSGLSQRDVQEKDKGKTVPVKIFADPARTDVSALWAMDLDEGLLLGTCLDACVVHNPNARNRLPRNLLPAHTEYVAVREMEGYVLKTCPGWNVATNGC
jgi:hypothetical protein